MDSPVNADLHPAPAEPDSIDHRDTANREQSRIPSEIMTIYKRVVEDLAEDLQIHPLEADDLIRDGAYMVTKGQRWDWWDY